MAAKKSNVSTMAPRLRRGSIRWISSSAMRTGGTQEHLCSYAMGGGFRVGLQPIREFSQESHSTGPSQEFFRTEAAAGALLVVCACAALVAANSGWADAYHRLWEMPVVIAGGGHGLSLTLHQWINDGLMAVFFLLVGLEIKREALAGELASLKHAALPYRGRDRRHARTCVHLCPRKRRRNRGARLGDPHGDGHCFRAGHLGVSGAPRAKWPQGLSRGPGHRG